MSTAALKEAFIAFVEKHKLFQPDEKLLLAVSGGMDSIVLVYLFKKCGFDFGIAHCNFCLRGEESDADEEFVRKLATKNKVPFYIEHFSTERYAQEKGVSIQMAARHLRYRWFEKVREENNYAYIVTAHHKNDATESILLNLVRGTGVRGLKGIAPKLGNIIRPLLFAQKEDLYDTIVEQQLVWREDSSNESTKYKRNFIRQEIIPKLEELNPSFEEGLHQTAQRLSLAEQLLIKEVQGIKAAALRVDGDTHFLKWDAIEEHPLASGELVYELLRPYHCNSAQAQELWALRNEGSGKQVETATHSIVVDRGQWVICPLSLAVYGSVHWKSPEDILAFEGGALTTSTEAMPQKGKYKFKGNKLLAELDLGAVEFPLTLRPWKQGDWFVPLGMRGKKLVSDFLIDEKVPRNLKDNIWVLCSGHSIVWLLGMRVDDRFKIREKTENVLLIEWSKEKSGE